MMVAGPRCLKCGKHISDGAKEMCYDCESLPKNFDKGIALYEYRSVEQSILAFKNKGRQEYSKYFVAQMSKHLGESIKRFNAQAIIPIPLHVNKFKMRGYNQAELLATGLSRELGIPVYTDILYRKSTGKEQKVLSSLDRRKYIKKAFHMAQNSVKLKTVILVDDVYTTGATIDAASLVLKAGGVEKVYFVTLAIGSGIQEV